MSSQHTATPLRTQYYTSTHLTLHHCLSTLHAYTILYEYTLIPLTDLATYYASTPHRDHTSIVILLMSNQLALIISTYYSTVYVTRDVINTIRNNQFCVHICWLLKSLICLLCCLLDQTLFRLSLLMVTSVWRCFSLSRSSDFATDEHSTRDLKL